MIRIILGALLLEVVLIATLVPLSLINMTLFLTAVPIAAFVFGYLVSWWILRKVSSARVLHGALIGIVATAMYLGLVAAQPGGFAAAVGMYGVPLFWFCQAMRIAGCVAGAARRRSRTLLLAALVVLVAPPLTAAGWNKAYFAATKPGSFATVRTSSNVSPPFTSTLTRLSDRDGKIVIEQKTDFGDKTTPNTTNRYVLAKGFDVDRDIIDFMRGLAAASYAVSPSTEFQDLPAEAIDAMRKVPTYAQSAVFKGTETVAGKPCDHYTYTRSAKGDPQFLSGEVWLNPSVPFGVVKETTKTTDPAGKVLFVTETLLVDSGTKALPAMTTPAAPVAEAMPETITVKAAYEAGLIVVRGEIAPADKRGDHLKLVIETKGRPLTLTLAAATTSLHVDVPFDDLVFRPASAQRLEVTADHPATLVVNQIGERRVVAGKFTITTDAGKPYFQGSATVGYVK